MNYTKNMITEKNEIEDDFHTELVKANNSEITKETEKKITRSKKHTKNRTL